MQYTKYTEKDVAQLVADVEKAFTAHLAKAEEVTLAKSEDGEKDHKEKEEHKDKPEHEAKKEEHHEEGEKHEEHESKEHGSEDHKDHDYDQEDMEHMEKLYRSMSKGEMGLHHECLSKCMGKAEAKPAEMSKNEAEGHKNGGEMSACEPKDVPGAKSPASKADGDQMQKSENQEVELLKTELNAQKANNEDLKKNFEAVQEFLTHLVKKTAPQGKAITSLEVIAKSELPVEEKALSKKEITEILKSKTSDPSLKKSDRDAVNSYYLSGQVNVNSISHLLK
jgi:hypothetical protein